MSTDLSKPAAQEPLARKGKRPARGARIQRRRLLALQRRKAQAGAVTSGD